MCGLLGYVGQPDLEQLQKTLKSLLHRGPDGSDFYFNDHLYLGHTRLAINDLSTKSAQPMHSSCGNYTIIFNGEIYNHFTLRQELQHETFITSSDTETLLYAWKYWGSDCLQKLEGIFAFAIYEHQSQEIYLVRDQMGVKPLYYTIQENNIAFSSEIKTLQQAASSNYTFNTYAAYQYTQLLFSQQEYTLWNEVKRLQPGHYLKVNTVSLTIQETCYYEISFPSNTSSTETVLCQQLEELLFKTIEDQHLSDAPLGYLLSGGIDSSAIVALSRAIYPERFLQAFTLKPETSSPDFNHAKLIAKHTRTRLEEVDARYPSMPELTEYFIRLEEPIGELAPWYTYLLAERAKSFNYKVLLSGHGADELWAGYRRHQITLYDKYIQHLHYLQKPLHQSLTLFSNQSNIVRRLKKFSHAWHPSINHRLVYYYTWMHIEDSAQLFNTTTQEIHHHVFEPHIQTLNQLSHLSPLQKLLYLDQKQYLPNHNLLYTDKMGMAHGVEIRVPFLQQSMVNFVNALPDHYKLQNGTTKYLLKKVLRKHLPKSILNQKKYGFGQAESMVFKHVLINSLVSNQPSNTAFQLKSPQNLHTNQLLSLWGIQKLLQHKNKVDL
jgi:asparagine synthase (glutamine-hydrolysing)